MSFYRLFSFIGLLSGLAWVYSISHTSPWGLLIKSFPEYTPEAFLVISKVRLQAPEPLL